MSHTVLTFIERKILCLVLLEMLGRRYSPPLPRKFGTGCHSGARFQRDDNLDPINLHPTGMFETRTKKPPKETVKD